MVFDERFVCTPHEWAHAHKRIQCPATVSRLCNQFNRERLWEVCMKLLECWTGPTVLLASDARHSRTRAYQTYTGLLASRTRANQRAQSDTATPTKLSTIHASDTRSDLELSECG
jgi:hypothetical protein